MTAERPRAEIVLQVSPVANTVAAKAAAWAQLYWLASPADCRLAMNRALGLADDAGNAERFHAQHIVDGRPGEQQAAAYYDQYRVLAVEQVTP